MNKIKYVYEVVVAVEMAPEDIVRDFGRDPIIEPNGKSYLDLGIVKAGFVTENADLDENAAEAKAVRTAAYWFKVNNPEWTNERLVGLSPVLVKRGLVR